MMMTGRAIMAHISQKHSTSIITVSLMMRKMSPNNGPPLNLIIGVK